MASSKYSKFNILMYILIILFGISTLFPKKYPEFAAKFDQSCQVDREKPPTELDMIEIDQICAAYAEIVSVFPELLIYEHRINPEF